MAHVQYATMMSRLHKALKETDEALGEHLKEAGDSSVTSGCGDCMRLCGVRGGLQQAIKLLGGRVRGD